ncbi:hypothetical protein niasHT_037495 [Heterodera trifolii]|uniref:Nondiscriminating glutamyl-tRNA synthetase EARS2, mitochondrial n=1 Tax=Heterodera trifolii TaxID=157864 RepID=A0ABD2IPI2_9BILA
MVCFPPSLLPSFQCFCASSRLFCSTSASIRPVRVRFAPSPTGELHLGSVRTALFNFLWARKYNGKFVLRIEDTDRERLVEGSEQRIEQTLSHFGLTPDESPLRGGQFGPYYQSERLPFYRELADQLVDTGHSYKCFCSQERLEFLRRKANSERIPFRYDGICRQLSTEETRARERNEEQFVVRFKFDGRRAGFTDIVFGDYEHYSEEGDFVILKRDGFPTYHFANVVDDRRMEISHVIRGAEWICSTTKHLQIYSAFGWSPPHFAHLPLITLDGKRKLSKRFEAGYADFYLKNGHLPIAVLNFLLRNGSGIRDHQPQTVYSLEELIERFDERLITRGSFTMDTNELNNYGKLAFKQTNDKDLLPVVKSVFDNLPNELRGSIDQSLLSESYLRRVLSFLKLKEEAFCHLGELSTGDFRFFFYRPRSAQKLLELVVKGESDREQFVRLITALCQWFLSSDTAHTFDNFKLLATDLRVPYQLLAKIFRLSMIDNVRGPPIKELIEFFGVAECYARLNAMGQMFEDETKGEETTPKTTVTSL